VSWANEGRDGDDTGVLARKGKRDRPRAGSRRGSKTGKKQKKNTSDRVKRGGCGGGGGFSWGGVGGGLVQKKQHGIRGKKTTKHYG